MKKLSSARNSIFFALIFDCSTLIATMNEQSYYSILRVSSKASFEEIRKAYKSLVLISHPDKSKDRHNEFLSIAKAWEILGDPEKRKHYDANLEFEDLQSFAVSDQIYIGDFETDEDGNYYHICRCQNEYVLSPEDVDYLMRYVSCSGCSLSIEVVYNKPS